MGSEIQPALLHSHAPTKSFLLWWKLYFIIVPVECRGFEHQSPHVRDEKFFRLVFLNITELQLWKNLNKIRMTFKPKEKYWYIYGVIVS